MKMKEENNDTYLNITPLTPTDQKLMSVILFALQNEDADRLEKLTAVFESKTKFAKLVNNLTLI